METSRCEGEQRSRKQRQTVEPETKGPQIQTAFLSSQDDNSLLGLDAESESRVARKASFFCQFSISRKNDVYSDVSYMVMHVRGDPCIMANQR